MNSGRSKPSGSQATAKVMAYYEQNRRSVARITRFDILDLQHRLPRRLLQLPYDILNRINRRKLLKANTDLTSSIRMEDYRICPVSTIVSTCFTWPRNSRRASEADYQKKTSSLMRGCLLFLTARSSARHV